MNRFDPLNLIGAAILTPLVTACPSLMRGSNCPESTYANTAVCGEPPRAAPVVPPSVGPPPQTTGDCTAPAYAILVRNGSPYLRLAAKGANGTQKMGTFLVDTGANTSAIDATWAASVATIQADRKTATIAAFSFGYDQKDVQFHVQDLGGFSPIDGEKQAGTLGTDFLSEFVLDLDFENKSLRLIARQQLDTCSPSWRTLSRVDLLKYSDAPPTEGEPNIPTVELSLGSLDQLPCQLDTGTGTGAIENDSALSLNPSAFAALGVPTTKVNEVTLVRTGKSVSVPVYGPTEGTFFGVQLGSHNIEVKTIVVQGKESAYPFTVDSPYALMGMSVMQHWERIVLDPFGRAVWYKN